MVIPASQGTAIFERGSRGRDRTVDHRVKACCRNRLATRLCVAVSSGWSRLCLPCRIWQTHRRYSALSTRGFLCACTTSWTRAPLRIHPSKQRLFTFQPGGRGGIRTHGCFHIGGFQDRCLHPLGNPSFGIGYWVTPRRNRTSVPAGLTGVYFPSCCVHWPITCDNP